MIRKGVVVLRFLVSSISIGLLLAFGLSFGFGFSNEPPSEVLGILVAALASIDRVIPMINGEDHSPIELHLDEGLILVRQPELSNLLKLPHQIRSVDSERQLFGRRSGDPDDGEVLGLNPDPAFKQVFVSETQVSKTIVFEQFRQKLLTGHLSEGIV
jgi:hypothetical protein